MLHPFVSGHSLRPREELGGLSASVAVHVALVAAAVALTAAVPDVASRVGASVRITERLVFTLATRAGAASGPAPVRRARAAARRLVISREPVPTELPAIDAAALAEAIGALPDVPAPGSELAARASEGIAFVDDGVSRAFANALGRQAHATADADGAYTADVVEKIVAPVPGNPVPRYPDVLLAAGVEADVNVRFVVDSAGRVIERTLEFPAHAHRQFVAAVRRALLRSRFLPAEIAGQRVAQHVTQRYSFVVAR